MITRILLAGLMFAPFQVILAQDTTVVTPPPVVPKPVADSLRCGFCHRPSVPAAIFEGVLVNVFVNA